MIGMRKMSESKNEAVYDAQELGTVKMLLLGLQHTFAMFGATILVPIITGLNIATTLLMAGLGTLIFHMFTKGKVPVFLGSSFAFLGGYAAVAPMLDGGAPNKEMLPYACLGVAVAGLVYLVFALLIKAFGTNRIMRFFPPVVTGPIIISIGLILAPSAISNCKENWLLAIVALAAIIICNIFGKGMVKIVPIIIGLAVSYILAVILGEVDFLAVQQASWIGLPFFKENFITNAFGDSSLALTSIIAIVPISLATMMEHIGDVSAICATTGKNFLKDPGLHRTLIGDGVATTVSSIFGGPANTTYGENTGVLVLTKVYDPKVIRIAAFIAIILSFSPKVAAMIGTIPMAVIGGISFVLYGMISAVGARNLVENNVDFSKSRNLIIAAVILVCSIGIDAISFSVAGAVISLSGLAVAAIAAIVLNIILPGNDYVFDSDKSEPTAVNFKV
jgi:uracil permease